MEESTWIYILVCIVVLVLLIVTYVIYGGYSKIKGNKLPHIFCPKFSHPVIGHLQELLHPLKHEFRRQLADSHTTIKYFQLVIMNQASIFINCPYEAAKLLKEVSYKGKIYTAFRYDPNIPDLFTSDNEAYQKRNLVLVPAIEAARMHSDSKLFDVLLEILHLCAESNRQLDLKYFYSLFAMDIVCESLFNYQMGSLSTLLEHIKSNGSNEIGAENSQGKRLLEVLQIFQDVQSKSGIYAQKNVREISTEELAVAKADWKKFLLQLAQHLRNDCELYRLQNSNQLDRHDHVFSQAIAKMLQDFNVQDAELADAVYLAELHQLFRHAFETLSGSLMWTSYVLYRYSKVRDAVEKAILEQGDGADYPEYLEAVLLEVLRRYPVAGNLIARAAERDEQYFFLNDMLHSAPADTAMHVHIYSSHNSHSSWQKPLEFLPERWLSSSSNSSGKQLKYSTTSPRCPFVRDSARSKDWMYEGVGFAEDAVSFLPFSAGERCCKGKALALQVLRKFLLQVSGRFRLDAVQLGIEEDPGISYFAAIVPISKDTTLVNVQRIVSLHDLVHRIGVSSGKCINDEGWAVDE